FAVRVGIAAGIAAVVLPRTASAQQPDSSAARLPPVIVESARGAHRSPLEIPSALSVLTPDSSRPGQRHLSLDETLVLVPGLTVSNRNNPSQDPRISIRGFGARSAFGVRGIRVLRDGIPLTLPDGQTPVDYLDLESVGRVEVLRGSASSLYGNAGGGVIDIRSSAPAPVPLLAQARLWTGSFGNRRLVGKASGSRSQLRYQGNVARTENSGFRDYSRQTVTTSFARVSRETEASVVALQFLGMSMPEAENPGALTAQQMSDDPRMADPLSVRKRARKAVDQSQLGVTARRAGIAGEIEASAYVGGRSLDNPLAFAVVDVERTTSGASLRARLPHSLLGLAQRLTGGAELQLQNDLRRNFANCNDVPPPTAPTAACPDVTAERGAVALHQRELVSSIGGYLREELTLGSRVIVTAAARADRIRFEVRDRLVDATNPDDSGERSLAAASPMFGILGLVAPTHSIYANVSTAFETPTATELGNQPSGAAGINRELKPQRSTTYETGIKGRSGGGRFQYDASLFLTSITDELVPFDIPESNGRRFFRNAGRTSRRGVELGMGAAGGPVEITAAYSYANFRFTDFRVDTAQFAGNRIPGIPRQLLQGSVTLRTPAGTLVAEATAADRMFVNDANSESAPGFATFNVRLSSGRGFGRTGAEITLGVHNVLNRRYASSVSVNAAAGKYYEPAATRAVYVGATLSAGLP
ncbi:MAG TPA: TonB-dependent receptor, partial [Gemmatimonadaceae bacterium]|nr:TonB-dependent receptor [Gemmatimonadaceae bacterium]